MLITPAMIPHDQFHLGIWLSSVQNPCWYYFSKKKNTNIISNDAFLETVDAPLRKLVTLLHDHQVRTTPSCSGHYKPREAFEKIYSTLEEDKQKINHKGLLLKDVETARHHLFRDKHYQLPWDKHDFLDQAVSYQHKGVLGMRLGNRIKLRQKIHELKDTGIDIKEKDTITLILVEQANARQNHAVWDKITTYMEETFSSHYKSSHHL